MIADEMVIEQARPCDAEAVYALYQSLINTPYSTWSEDYPSRDIVFGDVMAGHVLIMRRENGSIVAAIAILPAEEEPEFDDIAPWYDDIDKWAVPSRLGVAAEMQGRGIAKRMLVAAMDRARENGCGAVRFLVAKSNPIAQRAYASLNFDVCGETEMWDTRWLCYQKRL